MFCPQCGKATNPTMNFCPYCSFPLKNKNENNINADNTPPANTEAYNPDSNLKFNIYNDDNQPASSYVEPSPNFKFDNSQNPSFSNTFDDINNHNDFNQNTPPQRPFEQNTNFQNQTYSNNENKRSMPPQNKNNYQNNDNNNQSFYQNINTNEDNIQNNADSNPYNSNVRENENDFQNQDYNPFEGYQLPNQNQTNLQRQSQTTNSTSPKAYPNRITPPNDFSQQNPPMATNIYSKNNSGNEKHPLFPDAIDENDDDSLNNNSFDFEKREQKKKHFYSSWPFIIIVILILCAGALLILDYFGVLNIFVNNDNSESSSSSSESSEVSQGESSTVEPSNTSTNPSADDKAFYLNLENTTFEEKFTGKIYSIDDEIIVDGANILAFDGIPESKIGKLSYNFSLDDLVIEEDSYKQIIILCSIENRTTEEFYLNPFYITIVSDKGSIYKPNLKENTSVETVLPDKLANGRMIYDIPNSDNSNLYIAYSNSENLDLAEFFIRI